MRRLSRVAGQALRGHRQSPGRFALLSLLIAIGFVIFLAVSALSRASTDQLQEAIETDAGAAGTYRVSFMRDLGFSGSELTARVARAVEPFSARPLRAVESFGAQTPMCPPFTGMGEANISVLRDANYGPVRLPFGENLPAGVAFCLAGLDVPGTSLYFPDEVGKRLWGASTVFVEEAYAPQVKLVKATPEQYEFIVITGRQGDMTDALQGALLTSFSDEIQRMAYNPRDVFTAFRLDSGEAVRAASQGVQIVYGAIAWGVLLLGGLGILVAQLIMLRDRTWFFGLSRAVGATPVDIATLVVADAAAVVVMGLILAGVIGVIGQPLVSSFGMQAFSVQLQLLDTSILPQLVLGVVAILLVGALFPAWKATRLDPLDILERR